MNDNQIKVWDIGVRIFHWTLLISFIIAWFSAEESELVHSWVGYFIVGLVAFRIIWGFIGTRYARFRNFIYSPSHIVSYLRSLRSKRPEHYLGHNPAGGLMILMLLLNLVFISWTGLEAWGAEGHGPFAQSTEFQLIPEAYASGVSGASESHSMNNEEEEYWEELHEFFVNLMLLLIVIHVLGVVISSKLHKENLVKSMINGYKTKR